MSDGKDKRVEVILQQLQQLPTLPAVAVRILEVTGREDSSAKEVVQLISADQSLTAKILQLVHRADMGVRGEVNTVERAVVLLGFEAVRSAVLAISVFQTVGAGSGNAGARFNREQFWRHCLAVGCCAELLAERTRGTGEKVDPSEAFVCGLLHDLGKVALDVMLPKSFDRVVEAVDLLRGNIADVERTVIGLDHMVIGKRLAERWQLPHSVRDCVWLHGQTPDALPPTVKNSRLINLITLADMIAREQHLGYSGNYTFPLPKAELMKAAGVPEDVLNVAQHQLIARIESRANVLGLGKASSEEIYLQALSQANDQLGRMSEQLASKNRRLAMRAKFFDALAEFQGELRPDAAPSLVLQAIGQTAVSVLQAHPVAIFSTQPANSVAEVLLLDESGEMLDSTIVECPQRVEQPSSDESPVVAAVKELEWLQETISPRLGGEQRFWIPLEAEGTCIGGVVWGAGAGEIQRLSSQAKELKALCTGWSLALRTAQIREESRTVAEQLAEANRQLQAAQSELLRSKTLVTVGEMAAGAAHEMNNPLAVISGRSQLLAHQLSDPKLKHAANTVFEQSHRLSQIITDLMDFAKPVPPRPVQSSLDRIVAGALEEVRVQAKLEDRKIECALGEVPQVLVDPEQVKAAILNIVLNAVQATDAQKGLITINAAFDAFSSRVVLSIADNGCGMNDETLKRCFDPFFSSLPAGRRRGLGLAKALRWIESSGGSIRLDSRALQGTRAMILLPAASPVGSERPAHARPAAEA